MSRLFLVRHGQASFLERNYDKLSPLGERQGRILGEYWAGLGLCFDRVYSGPRVRQRETARIVGEAYRRAGLPWPEPTVLESFDEFQAEIVMERSLPGLLERDSDILRMHQAFKDAGTRPEQFKTFQRIFEVVIGRWADGQIPLEGVEPWPEFVARVRSGLAGLAANGRSPFSAPAGRWEWQCNALSISRQKLRSGQLGWYGTAPIVSFSSPEE